MPTCFHISIPVSVSISISFYLPTFISVHSFPALHYSAAVTKLFQKLSCVNITANFKFPQKSLDIHTEGE